MLYTATSSIVQANRELEFEIRSDQMENLKGNKVSLTRIYLTRAFCYALFAACIFLLAECLLTCILYISGDPLMQLDFTLLKAAPLHYALGIVLYLLLVTLIMRFERISVAVGFCDTCLLFFSGIVFPLTRVLSYNVVLDIVATLL